MNLVDWNGKSPKVLDTQSHADLLVSLASRFQLAFLPFESGTHSPTLPPKA